MGSQEWRILAFNIAFPDFPPTHMQNSERNETLQTIEEAIEQALVYARLASNALADPVAAQIPAEIERYLSEARKSHQAACQYLKRNNLRKTDRAHIEWTVLYLDGALRNLEGKTGKY